MSAKSIVRKPAVAAKTAYIEEPVKNIEATKKRVRGLGDLYELTEPFLRINNLLEDYAGDVTDWPQYLIEALEKLPGQIQENVSGLCELIRIFEAEAAAYKREAARLTAQQRLREKSIEKIKERIETCMNECGLERIETQFFTVRMQLNNPGVLEESLNYYELPREFFDLIPKAKKEKIIEAWKKHQPPSGEPVQAIPGCIVIRTRSVRI